ncbi:MAG: tripartite tricarboxylate transporter substrate-binding protein [Alphaproteobacteria bacterium]|nr:tripartite tricarboxylate transporter substrate-binding protein [Alphaproteobacteria bacterium]
MKRRAALALLATPALAQGRPIRIIVPFSPGGQSDTVARLIAPGMAEALGINIVVENRPGAGGAVGAGAVAAATADGMTLLVDSFGFVVQPLIQRGLPFDYQRAFAAVSQLVALPYVLVVRANFPARDLAGYLAAARAGSVTFGSPGVGSIGHLAGALLAHRAGVRLEHVPYRGGQDAARDVAAGNLDSAISTANSLRPLTLDNRAHGIALTSARPMGTMANLPTIAASGFPGYDLTSWNGIFAPAATPVTMQERIAAAVDAALADAIRRERLSASGNEPVGGPPAAFAATVARDARVVRELVRETALRVE